MNWYKESQDQYDHIPEEHKRGSCFDDAFNYIYQHGIIGKDNDLFLVHAIITPLMGPLAGVEFGHAWIEKGDKVIDTSRNNEIMDKNTYYMLGGLIDFFTHEQKKDKIHRYSVEDAKKVIVDSGHAGPWEEKFDDFVLDNDEDDNGGFDQH